MTCHGNSMKPSFRDRLQLARNHALAVLMDQGKIVPTADPGRIQNATLIAMLGICFESGKSITSGSEKNALLHWHETGFKVYVPAMDKESKKQRNSSDSRLIKTAVSETLKNRKRQYFSKI